MKTNVKEIRDPIHQFIHVDRDEMRLIDSRPFQRLRHIHQLALSYLVYPGATHKRFEHSIGVMELAGRAFDAITHREHVTDEVTSLFPQITTPDFLIYWRKVLRLAALCHDLGHPPFSHAAEKELFPAGFDHESMTAQIIRSDELQNLWDEMIPPVKPEHLVKLSLGRKNTPECPWTDWEEVLSEIITGNALGVDRMDYLLRDAYHAGVGYGRFDHFRLLETLRILRPPKAQRAGASNQLTLPHIEAPAEDEEASSEPMLGLLVGGVHAAEALLLARYFMYAQVYFHPVRIAYNRHLLDFLKSWLPGGRLPTATNEHLRLTDNEVTSALREADDNPENPGHIFARRIIEREHFKLLYQFTAEELRLKPLAAESVCRELQAQFGPDCCIHHSHREKGNPTQFTVRKKDGQPASSLAVSPLLRDLPGLVIQMILIDPIYRDRAVRWRNSNLPRILAP